MGNKITTTRKADVVKADRFEPKLFIFQSVLRAAIEKYEFISLGEISMGIKRGQSPKPDKYRSKDEGRYIFVRTADVKKFQINTEGAVYLDDKTFETQKTNRISGEDLLISVVGNYLGSTSVIPSYIEKGAFNDNSARIRITDDTISPYYVSAFLNSVFGQKLILSLATRTGQKILSAGNVKKISLPKLSNRLIEEKYRSALKKEEKANKLITQAREMFYEKIGIDFKSIKKENIFSVNLSDFANVDLWTPRYCYPLYVNTVKSIKNRWPIVTLGEIAHIKKGDEVGSDTYIGYLEKRKTDVPFVRTSDIVNYVVDQYPDFFVPKEIYEDLGQGFIRGDILYTKDGKIGMVGMVTENDNAVISSGFVGLSLKSTAEKYNISSEYLFIVLTIREIGIYAAKRRTVIASTIPHLREERLKEIEVPYMDKQTINNISSLVKEAFILKDERKRLITEVKEEIDSYFDI